MILPHGMNSIREIRAYEKAIENIESFCNYKDIKELFMHFFRCSALKRFDCFDFVTAFNITIPYIEQKLKDHDIRTFEDFFDSGFNDHFAFYSLLVILDEHEKMTTQTQMVLLFDSIIHAQHIGGEIFEWLIFPDDPNTLRQKVENELHISNT